MRPKMDEPVPVGGETPPIPSLPSVNPAIFSYHSVEFAMFSYHSIYIISYVLSGVTSNTFSSGMPTESIFQ